MIPWNLNGRSSASRPRLTVLKRVLFSALLFAPVLAAGQESGRFETEIYTFSGSPLLLELTVDDPDHELLELRFLTPQGSQSFLLPEERSDDAVEVRLSPFLTPGAREVTLELRSQEELFRRRYEIGFVDFVFGRDNFRFGNNADYESLLGTYSEILAGWLEDRFGEAEPADLVILTDYMYSLFGDNPGRCYAFSGSELRYWRNPELLPSYYDSTYDIRSRVRRFQREMNYLQLDIVYDQFLVQPETTALAVPTGDPGAVDPEKPQSKETLLREVARIRRRIDSGDPGAVGFIGPELHHSMLVYGYIHDHRGEYIDLLTANNWKSGENLNLRSLDAERVRVFLTERETEREEEPLLVWSNVEGIRDRQPNRLFLVEVKEEYDHPEAPLRRFLERRRRRLAAAGRSLLVVENARAAWITDGEEKVTGYKGRRIRQELANVTFDRVKRNFRFEYPRDRELRLELSDDEGVRILHLSAGEATIQATSVEKEDPRVERRFLLGPGKPLLQESTVEGE